MKLTTLPLLALASTSLAASHSSVIIEPKTNISFSAFSDSTTGYTFGVALPTTPGTDFIGYLAGKGTGWSGVSLGGPMTKKLLVVAWPNSKATSIVGSFREVAYVLPFISLSPPSNLPLTPQELPSWKNKGTLEFKLARNKNRE